MDLPHGKRLQKKVLILLKVYSLHNMIELLLKEPSKRMTLKEILQHPWITRDIKDVREARRNSLPGDAFSVFSLVQPDKTDLLKEVQKKHLKE